MKGHVRKRGNKWCFVLDIGHNPETGKRKQKWFSGYRTKKDAQKALAEKINDIEKGTFVNPNKITVKDFLEQWLHDYAKPSLKPTTFQNYHTQIYTHTELADPPVLSKKEIRTLTPEEISLFLQHAHNDQLYIAFLLAITTGLRRGEILGLRWQDIDFEVSKASIQRNLVLIKNKPVLQEPKTKGSFRSITLPQTAISELKKHRRIQNEEKLLIGPNYNDHDLIIATSGGTPVSPRNLLRSFKRILQNAKLPDIRFHELRHTHATLMLQQGEHPKIVSERLGHSNTRITMDIYSHVLPNMQKEAVDRFEEFFQKTNSKRKFND